ncbi:MAG: hypothetical protein ACREJO_12290 [Phycisphaerales bacterium]
MSQQNMNNPNTAKDLNVDPKSGILGSHPVATGVGAVAAGAAAGAAGGVVAGPVGAVAGAAVGAVVGAVAGKATAEAINPTIETKFWRDTHASKPYATSALGYDEYATAYQYGWESYGRSGGNGKTFDSVESDLGRGWDKAKGASSLGWDKAKSATREAWARVELAAKDLTHSAKH